MDTLIGDTKMPKKSLCLEITNNSAIVYPAPQDAQITCVTTTKINEWFARNAIRRTATATPAVFGRSD